MVPYVPPVCETLHTQSPIRGMEPGSVRYHGQVGRLNDTASSEVSACGTTREPFEPQRWLRSQRDLAGFTRSACLAK
jgi:hypothetical protein